MSEEPTAREFTAPEQATILDSLRSNCCPACGNVKRRKQSFCGGCWGRLAWGHRGPLYHRAPEYFAAFWSAFSFLRERSGRAPVEGGALRGSQVFEGAEAEPGADDGRPMPGLPR